MAKLNPKDRKLFSLAARAAFVNPFTAEHADLDKLIGGEGKGKTRRQITIQAVHVVAKAVARLEKSGKGRVADFAGEDRRIITYVFLFEAYHRFVAAFDELILTQISAGDASCAVPFARDALSLLARRGLSETEALKYFATFYQMRRAFYFIQRSLLGVSTCMQELRRALWNNIFTQDIRWYERMLWNRMEDFSTLLLGETGTGKGAAAAAIGRSGYIPFDAKTRRFAESFTKTFVEINLSQFPETLIESELFGHRKGAFTGAVDTHEGVFALCSPHGAIFLDEIGDVSIPVQIKLLRVLQERVFSPVGSHEKLRFDGRVIAATNKSMDDLRRKGLFRDDFFYRLCSDVIVVPPLRQRIKENARELSLLLAHTLKRTTGEDMPELRETVRGTIRRDLGMHYPWPGNVREVEQCVRRILLTGTCRGDTRAASVDLQTRIAEGINAGTYDAQQLLADYCSLLYRRFGTYQEVARRTGLDRRTVKKYCAISLATH